MSRVRLEIFRVRKEGMQLLTFIRIKHINVCHCISLMSFLERNVPSRPESRKMTKKGIER